jgi:hypothetical protein
MNADGRQIGADITIPGSQYKLAEPLSMSKGEARPAREHYHAF